MGELDDRADALAEQRERRLRQLGTRTPRCCRCTETDPLALTGVAPDIVCYECRAIEHGRSGVEGHHISGRANDPDASVDLLGNDHRVASASQADWPTGTLRNPDASPLLKAAAMIRGWLDVLAVVVERAGWVPAFLERLDGVLREAIGATWWIDLGWEG